MAIKKTTVHPLTAFRKANEARLAPVKKSIQKAQEGNQVMAGPLSPEDDLKVQKRLAYNGLVKTNRKGPIFLNEHEKNEPFFQNMFENDLRNKPNFNTQKSNPPYKKGGLIKNMTAKKTMIKSKKK